MSLNKTVFSTRASFLCLATVVFVSLPPASRAQDASSNPQTALARMLGTVKTISGSTITLSPDSGGEVTVVVQENARLLRVEPGEKDLKNAAPLQLQDIQPGDRLLIRGKNAADGKSLLATSVIAMKKGDIAQKQSREREEWQKNGVGGLVSSVDQSTNTIAVATTALGNTKTVSVHVSKNTILRRYAPGSVKFDDAKPAPLSEIKPGDQLRARGTRTAEGAELAADEVVSGSFRNIAGTILSIDTAAGSINVTDLATKKPVSVKITSDSQLRKLPPPMAQRIAARLKGTTPDATSSSEAQKSVSQQGTNSNASPRAGSGQSSSSDLQQAISRMPAASLGDLNKGDAVMIVATSAAENAAVTAITLLAGVEPILEASPKGGQSILSPWSLSTGGGDAGS
jgi:Domain of unknown function (DUF5666)